MIEKTLPGTIEKNTASARNAGIDLLRISAMFMVVLLHVLGPGGILFEVKSGTANFAVAWFMEMAIFCAINCYGIISGYVGITSRYKYSNLAVIWLQVVLYSVAVAVFYHLRYPETFTLKTVLNSFFPVCNGYYWYFTAYVGMFLIVPLLNRAVTGLKKEQLRAVLVSLFVALCVLPSVFNKDIFLSGWGYSTLWLSFLYVVGAYIRLHGFFKNSTKFAWLLYGGCVILSWGVKMLEEYVSPSAYWADLAGGFLTQYSSPTMFLSAVALVVIFSKCRPSAFWSRVICVIAPCTFGVYIIHANPILWDRLITYKYAAFVNLSPWMMVVCAVLSALKLFAVLWAIDFVRYTGFRVLRIKPLLRKAETKILGSLWD